MDVSADNPENIQHNNNVEKCEAEEEEKTESESNKDPDTEQELSEVKIPPPPEPAPLIKLEIRPNGLGEEGKPQVHKSKPQPLTRSIFPFVVSPAAERIRFILGEEDDGPAPPQLFTELDELLSVDGQEMEWKETAR